MKNLNAHFENSEKRIEFSLKNEIFAWAECVVVALLCFIFITLFIGRVTGVDGQSMYPTLEDGDRVIVSNISSSHENGDIIVFLSENFDNPLVKRVIAAEGQTVDIIPQTGQVIVDNVILEENYINEGTYTIYDVKFPVTVPEGCVFVMGDNRNYSTDSRSSKVGMVDIRSIIGKVYAVITPLSNFGMVE